MKKSNEIEHIYIYINSTTGEQHFVKQF